MPGHDSREPIGSLLVFIPEEPNDHQSRLCQSSSSSPLARHQQTNLSCRPCAHPDAASGDSSNSSQIVITVKVCCRKRLIITVSVCRRTFASGLPFGWGWGIAKSNRKGISLVIPSTKTLCPTHHIDRHTINTCPTSPNGSI